jgi:hypothetical protein
MKARFFLAAVFTLIFLTVVSCNQGPIFFTISKETPPLKPLINGSPTNMVVFDRGSGPALYVASGRLYWYRAGGWDSSDPPEGKIIALAATARYLYALCINDPRVDTSLWRVGTAATDTWERVALEPGYPLIQSIHADSGPGLPGRLFAGARQRNNTREVYAVLYVDDSGSVPVLKILKPETSILSGAVCREDDDTYETYHYLSTTGGGVFRVAETDLADGTFTEVTPLSDESDGTKNDSRHFMGMIKLKDNTIIAIERGLSTLPERERGALYEISGGSLKQMKNPSTGEVIAAGRYATGALALWEGTDPLDAQGNINLLVAGIQGGLYNTTTTSYTYGYVEFDLNEDGSLNIDATPRGQGSGQAPLKSVADTNRYTASIGKHSINHLFQAPLEIDANMTFFASTQIAGLWSYRHREDGGDQWNAEN